MVDTLEAAAAGPSRIPAEAADKASLMTWIAVVAGMVGAFMAILNIQITNVSLRRALAPASITEPGFRPPISSAKSW
jgi:DHA2 family multidrug resistance protein